MTLFLPAHRYNVPSARSKFIEVNSRGMPAHDILAFHFGILA